MDKITKQGEEKRPLGDMDFAEFRRSGHEMIEWVADYLEKLEQLPVAPPVKPGQIRSRLPFSPPERGESMEAIFEDIREKIVPGLTHWNHPAFFSYFSVTGSGPGILGELLCSAFNVNAMLWKTSPAATELEQLSLDWLRQMVGLPPEFWGIIYDTASISTLHALAAAREAVPAADIRRKGLAAFPCRLRLYQSEQAHSSVEKAAIMLGLGQDGVRKIEVDQDFRMKVEALAAAIEEDLQQGWQPFCVVATAGTTSTTSIDPIGEIAAVCGRHRLWLHVDAAYAGAAAIVPELSPLLEGWEKADSVVINPHKWLFTPIDLSAFYCRRPEVLREAFRLVPEYLTSEEDENAVNFMDYGVQLGRRFRALKLWMVIRYFGRQGLVDRIRRQVEWARRVATWIDEHPEFERLAPTPFSTLCFRAAPKEAAAKGSAETYLDQLNQSLVDAVNRSGKAFLSHTRLQGKFTIRLAVGNIKTEFRHLEMVWQLLQEELQKLKLNA